MTSTYNSIDQLINWHYSTVCRYKLAETPAVRGFNSPLKNFANKIKSSKFPKSQKASFCLINEKPYMHAKKTEEQTLSLSEKIIAERENPTTYQKRTTYVNHVKRWGYINKMTLHITSGNLLSNIELYPSFYMALSCFGNQSPQIIKSKQAIAEFSVIKGAIIGARSNWAFIAAGLPLIEHSSNKLVQCLGIRNVFIFPELEKFNYYLFEPIGGLDLIFIKTQALF
jgi:hypothetical protein